MHAGYVWNTLRRLEVPASDLEDLTHDVFLKVNLHLGERDPARPVKPWLFGFAFRVASEHRRRVRTRREDALLEQDRVVDPSVPADAQIAAAHDRRLVLAALDGIDLDRENRRAASPNREQEATSNET
jgi:RNA polymerase sigma-70 factor (ECF subfamily)